MPRPHGEDWKQDPLSACVWARERGRRYRDGQRGPLGKSTHPHPLHARPSYLGCLMGTSNTSSGGIWKSSGSLPLAWSRRGRTSKRPLGGFQPCCMQICEQTRPGQASRSGHPPNMMAMGEGQRPRHQPTSSPFLQRLWAMPPPVPRSP